MRSSANVNHPDLFFRNILAARNARERHHFIENFLNVVSECEAENPCVIRDVNIIHGISLTRAKVLVRQNFELDLFINS